jgi:hypothetical protein
MDSVKTSVMAQGGHAETTVTTDQYGEPSLKLVLNDGMRTAEVGLTSDQAMQLSELLKANAAIVKNMEPTHV